MLIGVVGLIGSGKSTVARYLLDVHHFKEDSFASSLKDVLSVLFGWDRGMLNGTTDESRVWRETPDLWWAERLGIPNFTPRMAMQYIGTDVIRAHFNQDVWLLTVANKIRMSDNPNIVISDVRFPNEAEFIKREGGVLVEVVRGDRPVWWNLASSYSSPKITDRARVDIQSAMHDIYPNVHQSEWMCAGIHCDYTLDNNTTVPNLKIKIDSLIEQLINSRK